jgi:hypothetical protein
MGHHLFSHQGKGLPMHDSDVALTKHFLMEGARNLGNERLLNAIAKWRWAGPGVWIDVDETMLADHPAVFAEGIKVIQMFGEQISIAYLNENVDLPDARWSKEQAKLLRTQGEWLKAQETSRVVALVRGLEQFLHGPA